MTEPASSSSRTERPGSGSSRPEPSRRELSRRGLLRSGVVLAGGGLLAGCGSGIKGAGPAANTGPASHPATGGGSPALVSGGTITIGWIHPLTGQLAGFGKPDLFVISQIKQTSPYKNGFVTGGKKYQVVIKSYDTESSVTKAGSLAHQAINSDGCDLLLASSTPETVNAVATTCETLGTPLICANVPWESWYANLGGNPAKPSFAPKYVTMYFLGAEHLAKCFIPMWNRIHDTYHTDKVVAAAYPNDPDGNAFRAVFPPIVRAAGYTFDMSAPYTDGTTNYSSMISAFKADKADFFTNVPLPTDFTAMWRQSIQQGYRPRLATVAKVLLFPSDTYALGSSANNIATDTWWVPSMPWTSSFTGQTCSQLAAAYTAATGRQWNANISNYSLFEVAHAALTSAADPKDKAAVAAALFKVNIEGVAGKLDWTSSKAPAPGVVITPPVGIQWQAATGRYPMLAKVVDNTLLPVVKLTGDLKPTNP